MDGVEKYLKLSNSVTRGSKWAMGYIHLKAQTGFMRLLVPLGAVSSGSSDAVLTPR